MKKFLTSTLAMLLTLSCVAPAAFATDKSTIVEYTANTQEEFLLTVPASLEAGKSGDVTLKGKWPSNKTFTVSADKTVTMTCDIGGSEVLNVTFAGIELAGSNTVEVSETKQVSVDSMNALFGNWSGTFRYNLNSTDGSSSSSEDVDWSDAVEFTVTASNRAAVGFTDEDGENFVIPAYFIGNGENGTGNGTKYKVTKIALDAVKSTKMSGLVIPSTVKEICDYAFDGNEQLSNITLSEGLEIIWNGAFYGCSSLTNIVIPNTVTNIKRVAFDNCNLNNVTIGSGVLKMDEYAFADNENLTNITFVGTQAQWNAIEKNAYWDNNTGNYTIHCTDGDIAKS